MDGTDFGGSKHAACKHLGQALIERWAHDRRGASMLCT